MGGIGSNSGTASTGDKFKKAAIEAAKNAGTGPTPIEKKIGDAAVEAIRDAAHTVSNFVQTPEGTAITTGLLLQTTPFGPVVGQAFILGGAAYSALKYLDNHKDIGTTLAKDAIVGTAGIAITPINPVIGLPLIVAAATDAGSTIVDELTGTAKKAGQKLAKSMVEGAVKGAAQNAAKAIHEAQKPKTN
jgi:hypothetical protein